MKSRGLKSDGRLLTILWDKTGKRYGKGAGLKVYADGKLISEAKSLSKIQGEL